MIDPHEDSVVCECGEELHLSIERCFGSCHICAGFPNIEAMEKDFDAALEQWIKTDCENWQEEAD